MKEAAEELQKIVADFATRLRGMTEQELSNKPLPNKWSKKEVIGHLIDSAQNNLRRFICGQYESTPAKIVYQQDEWVRLNRYQFQPGTDVIQLWVLLNNQIAAVLSTMPKENYIKQSETNQLRTLEWLAIDYVKHLKHHLNQVIPNSFDIRYPS